MNEDKKLNFALTVNQVNAVLAALAKQPLEAVLEVFNSIQQQAAAQLNKPAESVE